MRRIRVSTDASASDWPYTTGRRAEWCDIFGGPLSNQSRPAGSIIDDQILPKSCLGHSQLIHSTFQVSSLLGLKLSV